MRPRPRQRKQEKDQQQEQKARQKAIENANKTNVGKNNGLSDCLWDYSGKCARQIHTYTTMDAFLAKDKAGEVIYGVPFFILDVPDLKAAANAPAVKTSMATVKAQVAGSCFKDVTDEFRSALSVCVCFALHINCHPRLGS